MIASNKTQQLYAWLLAVLFITAIALPPIFTLVSEPKSTSVQENRRLAPKPSFSFESVLSADYQNQFSDYYSDHFGLRESVLKGARSYRNLLYNKAVSGHVVTGKDDFLFFNADGSVHDFTGSFTKNPDELRSLVDGIEIKQQWLSRLGAHYLLVPVPGKMSIYPEKLPNRIRKVAGRTRLGVFRDLIKNKPVENHVVDATEVLQKAKLEKQVFFKTDTHWNEDGAYEVYRSIITKLSQDFPDLKPINNSSITRKNREKKGDIALAAGNGSRHLEPSFALEIDNPCADSEYLNLEIFADTNAYKLRPKSLPVVNGCPDKRLKAIVVHDSFGAYLKQYLSESFKEAVFMPSYDVYEMRTFIKEFQPDVFIDIRVDRRFHLLLEPDPRMVTELNLAR